MIKYILFIAFIILFSVFIHLSQKEKNSSFKRIHKKIDAIKYIKPFSKEDRDLKYIVEQESDQHMFENDIINNLSNFDYFPRLYEGNISDLEWEEIANIPIANTNFLSVAKRSFSEVEWKNIELYMTK